VTTVSPDPVRVESELRAGTLVCPSCHAAALGPWGWARERPVGRGAGRQRVRPRRGRCRGCGVTHVLLPVTMLVRRGDWAVLIGKALELKAAGRGQRPIAVAVGVSRSTVRGWLSRFAEVAEEVRAHLVRWALWLDAGLVRLEPTGSPLGELAILIRPCGPILLHAYRRVLPGVAHRAVPPGRAFARLSGEPGYTVGSTLPPAGVA
jgi:transposase-like protein